MLVDKGLDPNVEDDAGTTPLGALDESGFRAPKGRQAIIAKGGKS